ncbi:TROVE domain-containing protein [Clostridium sp. OS1-26]|uniref:TROVE domain-containing protein n=1 Tax=Clostridium sp. OS1-26 TaxID=3070681 RepID=UPI0027DFAF03|nr:TROVE domain-containing protein [Clostridium sp. OS1-26]WML32985.1 TROVE domain-containing protein [Clostridium sp. OS1-26]
MSKFNVKNNIKTTNISWHEAYKMKDKDKLLSQVLTSMFNEDKYYGDNSQDIIETAKRVIEADPKFVANLCIYARKEMNLRSVSHALIGELARSNIGKNYVRKTINMSALRVDDMTEILAYYVNSYGKPIPNSIKKGIADVILGFDEYQLAKYNRKNEVKLKDIFCLTHPKAKTNEQNDMFKRLLEDKLQTPITWETQLSARGNKKEVWEELIENNKLGYMAMVRNLRNIIKSDVKNINKVYEFLSNEQKVLNNRQLPFRYYSAYKTLKSEGIGTSKVFDSLEMAIKHSTKNISKLSGKTLISADVSGSMNMPISRKSEMTCAEIAVLLMSIANYICEETITTTFDTSLYMNSLSTQNRIIANANSIKVNGGGTDISLPLKYLLKKKIFVDRIIILSDNEINRGYRSVCQTYVEEYKRLVNPKVWVHAIDMQGYGTQQFSGDNVNIISGWSEKVLDFMNLAEQGIETLRDKIDEHYFKEQVLSA